MRFNAVVETISPTCIVVEVGSAGPNVIEVAVPALRGLPGPGVPSGGVVGQVLRKSGPSDHHTEWGGPILLDPGTAALPAPADGVLLFGRIQAGRQRPAFVTPSGPPVGVQALLASGKVGWWTAAGGSVTAHSMGLLGTTSGTATTRAVATDNLFKSTRRLGLVTAATAGSSAGLRDGGIAKYWRGNGPKLGGFEYVARFGISAYTPGMRAAVGLFATVATLGNADPSAQTNAVLVGKNAGATTLHIMHNDGAGACTTIDLGAGFPADTKEIDLYEVRFFCAPNSNRIGVSVERLNTGDLAEATLTADLPDAATLLAPQIWVNNGTAAVAVGVDVVSQYIETDF